MIGDIDDIIHIYYCIGGIGEVLRILTSCAKFQAMAIQVKLVVKGNG